MLSLLICVRSRCCGLFLSALVFILVCERRPGARVHLFVFAAPPRRCLLLFSVVRHRRAAAMSAGDGEGNEDG